MNSVSTKASAIVACPDHSLKGQSDLSVLSVLLQKAYSKFFLGVEEKSAMMSGVLFFNKKVMQSAPGIEVQKKHIHAISVSKQTVQHKSNNFLTLKLLQQNDTVLTMTIRSLLCLASCLVLP